MANLRTYICGLKWSEIHKYEKPVVKNSKELVNSGQNLFINTYVRTYTYNTRQMYLRIKQG